MVLAIGIGLGLTVIDPATGRPPVPPAGYALYVDYQGRYLVDLEGRYLMGPI